MKIGIDGRAAKWYRGTGIGTYTFELINSINNVDRKNDYLMFMPEDCSSQINLSDSFKIKNINANIQGNFWDEVNIPNILSGEEIELYHVPQNGIGLPVEKKCPFVITLHDVIPFKMPETVGERYLKIFLDEIPKIIPLCDGIITVSEFSKNDIINVLNYPKDKIHVTHLAAEEIYKPLDNLKCKDLIKKIYSINGDFILYIGGFSPRKNIIGLIEAFSKLLSSSKKDIYLVIAGKQGISYKRYKRRAEELHIERNVIFPGFIPIEHLPYLYNASKLFAYPSFYEGFGLPPIEAMSCGIPVVTSNTTSIPEIVKDCALTVDPHNTDDLFMALDKALNDNELRNTLVKNGLKRASELKWNNTARDTINAYNKILHT